MVTVIDFDGTLALGDTKDINTMIPNLKLVSLINSLYNAGNTIKIVTARGCKSCNNFLERHKKYFDIIPIRLLKDFTWSSSYRKYEGLKQPELGWCQDISAI